MNITLNTKRPDRHIYKYSVTRQVLIIPSLREIQTYTGLFSKEAVESKEGEPRPPAYITKLSDSTALVTINIHEPVYQPGQACRPTLSSGQLLSQIATSEFEMAGAQWLMGNLVTCVNY